MKERQSNGKRINFDYKIRLVINLKFCIRYKYFIKQQKLKDSQCIILAHHKPDTDPTTDWQVPTGNSLDP